MPTPEELGQQLYQTEVDVQQLLEKRNFKRMVTCGCALLLFAAAACPVAAKIGWDALGGSKTEATPDTRPRATNTPYFIPVPTRTETAVPANPCVTVREGDYAFKIYQELLAQGHDEKKAIFYYPAGGGGPFVIAGVAQLPVVIHPDDLFCGQR